jgi:hypothetical protein
MTCRCKYQFCYVCGKPWNSKHYGDHDENGELIVIVNGAGVAVQDDDDCPCCGDDCCECECCCCEGNCCDCECDNDCECCACCDDCCLGIVFKCLFKMVLMLLFILSMVLVFICRDMLVFFFLVFASLLSGMFAFSIETLCDQEGALFILGVIFFPITMVIGIVRGFQEIFCDTVP